MHGHIFHMSQSNVSKWVHLLHGALNYALSPQHLLPARTADELAQRLQEEPPPSAAPTPLLPFIHDGVERPIHRPSDKVDRELYYSGKKKRHTLKNVLIVDEFGAIHFLSDTYEGRVHDKSIADEAKYSLPTASLLYQDVGFRGFDMHGVLVIEPKKKPRYRRLTPQEKANNRRRSSVRVRIEHVIGKVMETCCGLHNFRIRLKRKEYSENQSKP